MSDFTEGDPMIEELARPAEMTRRIHDDRLDDPFGFFRGVLIAVAMSLSIWGGLIWALTKFV